MKMFFLGMMVAWTPSLIAMAYLLLIAPSANEDNRR